jgi:hypothetical protein
MVFFEEKINMSIIVPTVPSAIQRMLGEISEKQKAALTGNKRGISSWIIMGGMILAIIFVVKKISK